MREEQCIILCCIRRLLQKLMNGLSGLTFSITLMELCKAHQTLTAVSNERSPKLERSSLKVSRGHGSFLR